MTDLSIWMPAVKWSAGAFMGAATGLTTAILKGRQDCRDKEHEVTLLWLQIIFAQVEAKVILAEERGAREFSEQPFPQSGMKLVDLANGLMRPFAAGVCIVGFVLYSTVLIGAMGHDLWMDRLDYARSLAIFQDSIVADVIMVVWGFLFGARNFKGERP